MIPILYAPDESNFDHGGIGALFETTSCVVGEECNGAFEIEFKYPVDGHLYKYIEEGCIVKAKPNDTADPQLFSIYRSTKPINGIVTFCGEHISYELSGNPVESVEVENAIAQDAIGRVLAAAMLPHNYTAQSDIITPNSTSIARASVRAALGGVSGSILSVWGGEYEFDNFKIKLHSSRGTKTGIKIAYGKNLTDLQQEKNISEVYVGVYPYAKYTPQAAENTAEQPEEMVVSLPEKIIWSPHAAAYARKRVCIKDFSDRFNGANEITEEQLREVVEAWVETSGFDVPAVSITVSFVHLWHLPEYAQYALLERVNLCDRVSVEFSKLGVSATAKVIKTKYDVLNEKYLSITLGSAKANFADTVNQTSAAIEQTKQEIKHSSAALGVDIKKAVDEATQAITGQSGGYVVLNPPKNPQEILIMDAPTITAAKNIWRWNSGGFGHSKNGYNGPFGTAITQDGAIVADFITAGTLRAIEIAACTIKGGSLNINDKFIVTTEGDATVAGKVTATSGTIGGCEIMDGVLKIKNANISEKLTAGSIDVSGVIKAGGIAILGDVEAEAKRATDAEGALSTRIKANADAITAEVERATAYEGTLSSRITQNADAITAEVERATAYEGTLSSRISANAEAITAEVTRARGAESSLSSRITATAEEISAEVERAESAESSLSSRITQNANAITAKVSSSGGSSSTFGWSLTSSGFYLYSGSETVMKVTSSGLEVSGKVVADSGSIGNLTITDKLYFGGNNSYYINANYNDGSYYIKLPGFQVDDVSGAVFSGKLSAPSGTIGGWTIETNCLHADKDGVGTGFQKPSTGTWTIAVAYTNYNDWSTAPFRVKHDGSLYAANATINGTISNVSGNNGVSIVSNRIEFLAAGETIPLIPSTGFYNASRNATVNGIKVDGAMVCGGDLILGRNLGFSDGNSFYMNGSRCLCGWIRYQKSLTNARYMRFVNGLLVAEANEITPGDYLGQIN